MDRTDWAHLFVSYCQYEVAAGPGDRGLEIYTLGDDLLHVGGPGLLTGFCGTHTGWIEARARARPGPPAEVDSGWDAISEANLWCPDGRLSVIGLMGGSTESLTDVAVPRGLVRVRVHARNRVHESLRTDEHPPEQHEFHIWPVAEETPWRTLLAEEGSPDFEQKPETAARWAMLSLVRRPSGRPAPVDPGPDLPRVTVVRHRSGPVQLPVGVIPAGDLEIRLDPAGPGTATWSWATAAGPIFPVPLTTLPDDEPSTVRLVPGPDGVTLRHEGVLGRHAAALGLIWDHLLDHPGSYPWVPELAAQAAAAGAQAERTRRLRAEQEATQWGGSVPSERVRALSGQARSLARMDRPLIDRIDALPADRQREVACWAARQAMRVAGLERIGWIAAALADAEAGRPLPRSCTEQHGAEAFNRLLSDPGVPATTVPLRHRPDSFGAPRVSEIMQAAAAFPALLALGNHDPLAAAFDALYNAAIAHGDDQDRFLVDARGQAASA